jgi:nitrogen fixation-related uncharacterized protein
MSPIHLWLNVAVLLVLVGGATFLTCLTSTTWFNDD